MKRWRRIKEWIHYRIQERTRGFSDEDLWNLDMTIAEFIAPRLIAYRDYIREKGVTSHPSGMSEQEWNDELGAMIRAFELIRDGEFFSGDFKEVDKEINHGVTLFCKRLQCLWD